MAPGKKTIKASSYCLMKRKCGHEWFQSIGLAFFYNYVEFISLDKRNYCPLINYQKTIFELLNKEVTHAACLSLVVCDEKKSIANRARSLGNKR
jgi:hypothetical protein